MGFEIIKNEKNITTDSYEYGDIVVVDNEAYLISSVATFSYHLISLENGSRLGDEPIKGDKLTRFDIIKYANADLDEYNMYTEFDFYKKGTYDLKLYLNSL